MKQIYRHHNKWEDFRNGMYCSKSNTEYFHIRQAIHILSNPLLFELIMHKMIKEWKHCIEHNLSNKNTNRKAYLGAASCNFSYKVPEYCTRIAWNSLDKEDQYNANTCANKVIAYYENSKQKYVQLCLKFI